MALSDFFRINLPYGMKKNSKNEWFFFNRDYVPLGWNKSGESINTDTPFPEVPVHTKYKGLTENTLIKLAWDNIEGISRNKEGKIEKVFFYNDRLNPQSNHQHWDIYFDKIKLLSKCEVMQNQFI